MKKDVHARKWRRKKPRDELFRERDVSLQKWPWWQKKLGELSARCGFWT